MGTDILLPPDTETQPTPVAAPAAAPAKGNDRLMNLALGVLNKTEAKPDEMETQKQPQAGQPLMAAPAPVAAPPASTKEDNLVAMRKKLESDKAEWEAKLTKAETDRIALAKQANELETRLAKYDIRDTLTYQEKFGQPEQQARAMIGDALTKLGTTEADWQAVIAAGPAKVQEYLTDLQTKGKVQEAGQLVMATNALHSIGVESQKFVGEHQAKMADLRSIEATKQLAAKDQMRAHREAELGKVVTEVQTQEAWGVFLQPRDGQADWNAQVQRMLGEARTIIDSNDFHRQAKAAHALALMPGIIAQLGHYRKEISELRGKLGSVAGAAAAGAAVGGSTVAPMQNAPVNGGWQEQTESMIKGVIGQMRAGK